MIRRQIAAGCLVASLLLIAGAVYGVIRLQTYLREDPFMAFRFSGPDPFENEPGPIAKNRLGTLWPNGVDAAHVVSVSFKGEASLDSHSIWYRVAVGDEDAKRWEDVLHRRHAQGMVEHSSHIAPEGFQRAFEGSIPLRFLTGQTPNWWRPPDGMIRATEIMDWYTDNDSGYGTAIYSLHDKSTQTLWVYDYVAQHDRLWERGNPPEDGAPLGAERNNNSHLGVEQIRL